MADRKRRARGELESEVMAALWAADRPLTPADVQVVLGGGLAYNTVQTILIRLLEKDLVRRDVRGRGPHVERGNGKDEPRRVAQQDRVQSR